MNIRPIYYQIIKSLNKIFSELVQIKKRLDHLEQASPINIRSDFNSILLKLPDHLRNTMLAMIELKEATANMVAEKTGKARAMESCYLNQLTRMGLLRKKRRQRKVFFYI